MKKTIKWDECYSIDHGPIDQQHQQLFSILARLEDDREENNKTGDILKVIDELYLYTEAHFTLEEAVMKKTAYDKYDEHKALHDEFRNRFWFTKSSSN